MRSNAIKTRIRELARISARADQFQLIRHTHIYIYAEVSVFLAVTTTGFFSYLKLSSRKLADGQANAIKV